MGNTWEIHDTIIDFSERFFVIFYRYMRNTWEIHEKYIYFLEFKNTLIFC